MASTVMRFCLSKNAKSLPISFKKDCNYSFLSYLLKLEELSLRYCDLLELPKEISMLKELKKLEYRDDSRKHRGQISPVLVIGVLKNLLNLETITIQDYRSIEIPREFKYLQKLKEIGFVDIESILHIERLFDLTQIEFVLIPPRSITKEEFEKLVNALPNATISKF
jgi:Leucine-rich repeat (LRR) protein